MSAASRISLKLAAVVALALAAGCAQGGPPPPPSMPSSGRAPASPGAAAALAPAAYLAAAASIDLFVIRASELALQRPLPPEQKRVAATLLHDHRGSSAQLSMAGRRLNLLPSATLLPRHQQMLGALTTSGDFAAIYRQQQIAIQKDALQLHSGFAARGSSPTLRPVAAAAAASARRHLSALGSR